MQGFVSSKTSDILGTHQLRKHFDDYDAHIHHQAAEKVDEQAWAADSRSRLSRLASARKHRAEAD